jgi:hypothetical protein
MMPRERLDAAINHQPVDHLCVDFGAGGQTGIGVCAVHRLRQALTGDNKWRVKVNEPYQVLGQIDDTLRRILGLDVVGVDPPKNMFGFENRDFKPFVMPVDGTEVLVPAQFNYTVSDNGDILMYPEGDTSAAPCAKMPESGYFFDSIRRQKPIIEDKLNPLDNCEEFGILSDDDIAFFKNQVNDYYDNTDYGIYLTIPAVAFGVTMFIRFLKNSVRLD